MNVFCIIGKEFDKEMVIDIIQEEGYKHNFFFNDGYNWDTIKGAIKIADEVWTFGDCKGIREYKYAKENSDCWIMG